ncbi:porin family protein [Hymenobacter psychrotolerans]|uniref:Outer membrane protein beta-barrel domain-containing protein n=1 Tax=Hymenobacter psychrotolerans DSM 18569 TaxID=1121959 RepID=A0A1M7AH93_9BACT|nr:hypothetical protein [Hymenobacter psychrotolerans]SHL41985.1 hypothetical protein SAMN02746009_02721 [Hymenobacter psychrotolerans DSM 18569]
MRRLLLTAPLLLASLGAAAQLPLADSLALVRPRWLLGARLGVAASWYRADPAPDPAPGMRLGPAAGLRVGYYLAPNHGPRVWLVAEPSYEQRRLPAASQNSSYLALPLYLRTGLPTTTLHVLLGGGRAWRLGPVPGQPPFSDPLVFRSHDSFVLLGLEADVRHRHRRTLALSGWVRYGVSAAYEETRLAGSGTRYSSTAPRLVLVGLGLMPVWYR